MYRALIVEDDPRAADVLAGHLRRFGAERGVDFSVEVAQSALEVMGGHAKPDIYFLDIGLPGVNGMEAAEAIRLEDDVTPIIFVTDLAQYAVQGYQVDALDFMVKPVSYEDFSLRMGRALRVLARNDSATVSIPTANGTRVVRLSEVIYVEVWKHNLYWHIAGEKDPLRVRGSLVATAEELGSERFCRISASHLINMGRVRLVRQAGVVMDDGTELAFTRSRKAEALATLARFTGGSI